MNYKNTLFCITIFLAGCGSPISEIHEIRDPKMIEDVKKGVRLDTRNPETTKFKNFRASLVKRDIGSSEINACGYILSENAFGGFGGYKPFLYESNSAARLLIAGEVANANGILINVQPEIVYSFCERYGIPIQSISLD